MKIIVIENSYQSAVGMEPSVVVYPDSCIFRNNEAFYLPAIHSKITMTAGFVIKIGKIGKGVQAGFAERYFSEIGLAFNFVDRDLEKALIDKNLNPSPASYLDRSFALCNTFHDFEITKQKSFDAQLKIDDTELTFNVQSLRFSLADILQTVTKYLTVKIGDYLYVPFINLNKGVAINDVIDGFMVDKHLIRCKVS